MNNPSDCAAALRYFFPQKTVEIEDEEKPALIADWIGYMFI